MEVVTMSLNLLALVTAMLTVATPLVWAGIGEVIVERTGILNLGIEGTMYVGAFVGFLTAYRTGSPWLGLLAAILSGVLAGLVMGLLTVTLGLNQHVSGLGLTLLLIAACEFTFRLLYAGVRPTLEHKFNVFFPDVQVLDQHWLTYVAFLVLAPLAWWTMQFTCHHASPASMGPNATTPSSGSAEASRGVCRQGQPSSW